MTAIAGVFRVGRLPGEDVDRVFKKGKRLNHPMATLIYRRRDASEETAASVRLGVVVNRGVARDAVPRNRLRRLFREAFRHQLAVLSGQQIDCVILARPSSRAIDARQKADRVIQDLLHRLKP